jgi:hypothetical protein
MSVITIPLAEFQRAFALYRFATPDETEGIGMLRLESDGKRRSWTSTDGRTGLRLLAGEDSGVYDLGLSWAMLGAAQAMAHGDPETELQVELLTNGATPLIRLTGPYGSSTIWDRQTDFPVFDLPLFDPKDQGGQATVEVRVLLAAVDAAQVQRVNRDDVPPSESFTMEFQDGEIVFNKYEEGVGRIDFRVAAPGAWGDVSIEIPAASLSRLLKAVGPHDMVTISLPSFDDDPISLESEDWYGFLMAFQTPNSVTTGKVEKLLWDMFGPVALNTDSDGDYPLRLHGNPIYGRFFTDDDNTLWFRVFAVVVNDIDGSPEVYAELNEQNANGRFARLFHVDTQVLAEVDILASALEAAELYEAIDRISTITEEVMPTLTAVLGGQVPSDVSESRWSNYRNAILEAETTPGRRVQINGADAVDDFPFPDRCHVITGWNPKGTTHSAQRNRNVNRRIAQDVVEREGNFVWGIGRSLDGDHLEESLFVWGLDREVVRLMGYHAHQDAIFEIDDASVHLVSCVDNRIESWPRRSAE